MNGTGNTNQMETTDMTYATSNLTNRYLTDDEISQMADQAVISYELTAEWGAAFRAASEFSRDEFNVVARVSAVRLAVRIAQTRWEAIRHQVQAEIGRPQAASWYGSRTEAASGVGRLDFDPTEM